MGFRVILILFASINYLFSGAGVQKSIFKRYPVESGIIYYDIKTAGHSKGFLTKTKGIARLVFDNWGARELKEEDTTEIQMGDYNETHDSHTMTLQDNGTIYSVDFDDGTIYKTRDRSLDLSIARGEDLSNENIKLIKEMKGVKIGKDEVAGFPCEVWRVKDQKICLYRGIPLRIVIDGPGFHSVRKAVHIAINQPIPKEQFQLPKFPIIVDPDYTSNESAMTQTEDYIESIKDLQAKMKEIGIDPNDKNPKLSSKQEREIIDILGARYLKKQKRLLPKLEVAISNAKECIKRAVTAKEAKECIEPINKIDELLGDKTENFNFSNFDDKKRLAILNSLEREERYLKATNICVQKYNKTSDVILCTEGNLGETEKQKTKE